MPKKKVAEKLPKFKPLTDNQKKYVEYIDEATIVFVTGPPGSGKTSIACAKALEYIRDRKVDNTVIIKPTIEAGASLGFLPGNLQEKYQNFVLPLVEEFNKFGTQKEIADLRSQNKIRYIPASYLRGYNLHNSFIIVDESSSFTRHELLMILTRLGKNSKMILTADVKQSDLHYTRKDDFSQVVALLRGTPNIGFITLRREDIQRNDLVGEILKRLL